MLKNMDETCGESRMGSKNGYYFWGNPSQTIRNQGPKHNMCMDKAQRLNGSAFHMIYMKRKIQSTLLKSKLLFKNSMI